MDCAVVGIIHKFDNAIETIRKIRPDILLLDINLGTQETKTAGITIAEALKDGYQASYKDFFMKAQIARVVGGEKSETEDKKSTKLLVQMGWVY